MKRIIFFIALVFSFSLSSISQKKPEFNSNKFDELFFDNFTNQNDSFITKLSSQNYCFYFLVQNNIVYTLTDTIPPEMRSFFEQLNKNAYQLFSKTNSGAFIFPISLNFKYKNNELAAKSFFLKDLDKYFMNYENQDKCYNILRTQTFRLHYTLIVN